MTDNIKLPPLPVLGPEWTPHWTKVVHDKMQSYAREAVRLNAQGVADGWKLVPVKPTDEMVKAAHAHHEGSAYLPHSLYSAMLSAAPAAPQPAQPLTNRQPGYVHRRCVVSSMDATAIVCQLMSRPTE